MRASSCPWCPASAALSLRLLLPIVGEIDSGRRARLDGNGLRQRAVCLMPGSYGLRSGWNTGNREAAAVAADGKIRVVDHADVLGHPAVYVAPNLQHRLFVAQLEFLHHPLDGFTDVEVVAVLRQAVDVVQRHVAVADLERLTDACPDDSGVVDARLLVDSHWLRWDRGRRERARQTHEDVPEAAVLAEDRRLL